VESDNGVYPHPYPICFNMYSEAIFQNDLDEAEDGLKVNGKLINNLRFADNTVIIVDSSERLFDLR